ncbi:hypothetical protein ACGFX4_35520 [Kitasatospora sp. NPDC048365]|uniref:hypothetical protein n=1 Tax=Kitasatospora sp. NPDC048365 TaxID=3364050 RepID=UPI00371083A2
MTGIGNGVTAGDGDLWIGRELAKAAAEVTVGPVPVEGITAGGRRIRNRRRTVIGALALASVVVLGSATAEGLYGSPGGRGGAPALAPAAGRTGGSPSQPSQPSQADRDPLAPVRVMIGLGTVEGKEWKVWAALWPVAPPERAYEQAVALWQDRSAVDPSLAKPTEDFVRQYWQPTEDLVNTYVTLDGVRRPHDTQSSYPAPGYLDPRTADTFSGTVLGSQDKSGTPGPLPIRLAVMAVGPGIGNVAVTWTDGTVTEPPLVTIGESPYRRLVVAEQPGKKVASWRFFDRHGTELPDTGEHMLTD